MVHKTLIQVYYQGKMKFMANTRKSRRLSDDEKSQILEFASEKLFPYTEHFLDPADSPEFHEGMAAGVLLAIDVIKHSGGLNSSSATQVMAIAAQCIKLAKQ
jgi:hypothetical protein